MHPHTKSKLLVVSISIAELSSLLERLHTIPSDVPVLIITSLPNRKEVMPEITPVLIKEITSFKIPSEKPIWSMKKQINPQARPPAPRKILPPKSMGRSPSNRSYFSRRSR